MIRELKLESKYLAEVKNPKLIPKDMERVTETTGIMKKAVIMMGNKMFTNQLTKS